MKRCFLLFTCCLLFFLSCTEQNVDFIQRENLFSLDIGPMEDQIALYNMEGDRGIRCADIAMRDGLFYIADGNGGKIVHYNSYGDILFMIYNDETNPEPVNMKAKPDENSQVTRWAFTYPFNSPGKIAIDSRKHIYAEEKLPGERHYFDAENKALLDSVILHFDEDGRFIKYLGKNGPGGEPLPRITGLYCGIQDEIIAVCRLPSGWNIHWYSSQGEQLFLVQLHNNAVPAPPLWQDFPAVIDAIIPSTETRKLYIKVDYYRNVFDESTRIRTNTEVVSSLIWILDVEDGSYEKSLEVPFYEYSYSERGKTVTERLLYSMMGLVRGGGILLYFPIESGYAVLCMDSNGYGQRRGTIDVDPGELRFNAFHLSPDGILSALLTDDWKVNVTWWRMDRFMMPNNAPR
jgi:hypothetical protein